MLSRTWLSHVSLSFRLPWPRPMRERDQQPPCPSARRDQAPYPVGSSVGLVPAQSVAGPLDFLPPIGLTMHGILVPPLVHGRPRPPCMVCAVKATSTDGTILSRTAAARPRSVGHVTGGSCWASDTGGGSALLASPPMCSLASPGAPSLVPRLDEFGSAHMTVGRQSPFGPRGWLQGWRGEAGGVR